MPLIVDDVKAKKVIFNENDVRLMKNQANQEIFRKSSGGRKWIQSNVDYKVRDALACNGVFLAQDGRGSLSGALLLSDSGKVWTGDVKASSIDAAYVCGGNFVLIKAGEVSMSVFANGVLTTPFEGGFSRFLFEKNGVFYFFRRDEGSTQTRVITTEDGLSWNDFFDADRIIDCGNYFLCSKGYSDGRLKVWRIKDGGSEEVLSLEDASGSAGTLYFFKNKAFMHVKAKLLYSIDGTIWGDTEALYPGGDLWIFEKKAFLISNRVVYCSDDGMNWEKINSLLSDKILYEGGLYYAVQRKGSVSVSEDGKLWALISVTGCTDLKYCDGVWVAASSNGIFYSEDGKLWYPSDKTTESSSVLFANGLWVAGGSDGMWYSEE